MDRWVLITTALLLALAEVTSLDRDGCEVDVPYNPFKPCPRNYFPICGTDRQTYANKCIFCQTKRSRISNGSYTLGIYHLGRCESYQTTRPTTSRPDISSGGFSARLQAFLSYFENIRHPWMNSRGGSSRQRFPFFQRLRKLG